MVFSTKNFSQFPLLKKSGFSRKLYFLIMQYSNKQFDVMRKKILVELHYCMYYQKIVFFALKMQKADFDGSRTYIHKEK